MTLLTNKAKTLLTGGGIAAGLAAYGAVSAAVTKKLVSTAMDRNNPIDLNRKRSKFTGSHTRASTLEEAAAAKKVLETRSAQTISIIAHDGIRLVGHWLACENPKRIILAMHGWRSSWSSDFGIVSDFWHRQNCSVLYAEQRGQGASGGEHMGFGLIERYDCLDWLHWINQKISSSLPIYLAGVSMGASTVLMASSLDLPKNVRGILADCGYTSVHAIWKHVTEHNLHLSYSIHGPFADKLCKKKIQAGTKDYSTTEALKTNRTPVFFVHGTADQFVPVEMTYENYQACRAPKRLFIVPGAGHGMSYFTDRQGYEKETKCFWEHCEKSN